MDDFPTLPGTGRRSLHLVDLEWLLGATATPAGIQDAIDRYIRASDWDLDDHVVVSAEFLVLGHASTSLDCGWTAMAGPLHTVHPRLVAGRHDRLVIGSGDPRFAELAAQVRALDRPVWAVAPKRGFSKLLREQVDHVVHVPLRAQSRSHAKVTASAS
jgi:hypothetical protein